MLLSKAGSLGMTSDELMKLFKKYDVLYPLMKIVQIVLAWTAALIIAASAIGGYIGKFSAENATFTAFLTVIICASVLLLINTVLFTGEGKSIVTQIEDEILTIIRFLLKTIVEINGEDAVDAAKKSKSSPPPVRLGDTFMELDAQVEFHLVRMARITKSEPVSDGEVERKEQFIRHFTMSKGYGLFTKRSNNDYRYPGKMLTSVHRMMSKETTAAAMVPSKAPAPLARMVAQRAATAFRPIASQVRSQQRPHPLSNTSPV